MRETPSKKQKRILVINAGSVSFKYALFVLGGVRDPFEFKKLFSGNTAVGSERGAAKTHAHAFHRMLAELEKQGVRRKDIVAVGHRVVHGGAQFRSPVVVSTAVLKVLTKLQDMAPLHNPPAIMGIKESKKLLPGIKNIAVFDTGFHKTLPPEAFMYALPEAIVKRFGFRKYGFHGISCAYALEESATLLSKPADRLSLIICHLGGGSSVTAVKNGVSVDTSMGFTPLEGVAMMTRSGDIDPGVLLALLKKGKFSPERLDRLLNHESGMKGIAGTDQMLTIINRKHRSKRAEEAFRLFCYRIRKYIGAYLAVLGHIDALVFTGSVGAGNPVTRKTIYQGIESLEHVPVLVIPAHEELMIARSVKRLLTH